MIVAIDLRGRFFFWLVNDRAYDSRIERIMQPVQQKFNDQQAFEAKIVYSDGTQRNVAQQQDPVKIVDDPLKQLVNERIEVKAERRSQ